MKRLYVGNLPYTTTDQQLGDYFAQSGKILAVSVIFDRKTGRSKGFGFVDMEDADAANAVTMMNGKDFGGRPLVVNEARPMKENQ